MELVSLYAAFDSVKEAIPVMSHSRKVPFGTIIGRDIDRVAAKANSTSFLHPQWGSCHQTAVVEFGNPSGRFTNLLGVDLFAGGEGKLLEVESPADERLPLSDKITLFMRTTGTNAAAQEQMRREKICLDPPADSGLISLYTSVPSFELVAKVIARQGCAPAGAQLVEHKFEFSFRRARPLRVNHVEGFPWEVYAMLEFIAPRSVFEAALSLAAGEQFPRTIPDESSSVALTFNSWLIKAFVAVDQ